MSNLPEKRKASDKHMNNDESKLRMRFRAVYGPIVASFFDGLRGLGIPNEELKAIPSLFLPACGKTYAQQLIKVAVIGESTLGWRASLLDDMNKFEARRFDFEFSFGAFQDDGPVRWQNKFWQYHGAVLESIYKRRGALSNANPIFSGVAWGNRNAIEPYRNSGSTVDVSAVTPTNYRKVFRLADECGVSSLKNFITVFKPDVIIYTCHNNYGSDNIIPEEATLSEWQGWWRGGSNFGREIELRIS